MTVSKKKRSRERAEKLTVCCVSYEQDTPAFKETMRMNTEKFAEFETLLNRTSVQSFDFQILPNSLFLRPFFPFWLSGYLSTTTRSFSSAIFVANYARSPGLISDS